MSDNFLLDVLELNRENIKELLAALDADYEMAEDPAKAAKMAAVFGGSEAKTAAEDDEMTDEERAGWLLEENAKAIAAAAEAAGASNVTAPSEGDTVDAFAKALGSEPLN